MKAAGLAGAAAGDLRVESVSVSPACAVTVVLASPGYPESTDVGIPIKGIEDAEALGAIVFHAGTAQRGDELLSAGGRVLNVTALGETFAAAREQAYAAVERIHFPGAQFRRDIRRYERLQDIGWIVVRVNGDDVPEADPDGRATRETTDRIAARLRQRGWLG